MRKELMLVVALGVALCLVLVGCADKKSGTGEAGANATEAGETSGQGQSATQGTTPNREDGYDAEQSSMTDGQAADHAGQATENAGHVEESEEAMATLWMKVGETPLSVEWEQNESVEALKGLCQDGPRTIQLSMYGGFEQVGSLGQRLPSDDVQTTTQAGDIVLYSSNQVVVFYGSNSWAYTRLGHIVDKTSDELAELLGSGDVTITIGIG
jgi:hypothetical protein